MGVEHYLLCDKCKEYIDLHKAYSFQEVINKPRPPVGVDCKASGFNDVELIGGYWESRGLWFLWKHKDCGAVEMDTDCNDEWFNKKAYLKEVFSHDKDLEIRTNTNNT